MDDSQLQPRTATRTRPRPIRFTPSRTDPVAPPPLEQHAAAEAPSLASRAFVWLLITAGWGVFVAWWVIVLQRESMRSLGVALGLVAATLATSALAMTLWTRHNIRIARKGKRGRSSLYIPMVFEHDTLGRPIELPEQEVARSAAEVRVVLRGGVKAYVVASEEEL